MEAVPGPVADERGRQWDAATGVLAAILFAVSFFLPSSPPKADDSVVEITRFFVDKRSSVLAASVLIALGAVAFLWWLGAFRSYLRAAEGGEGRLSAAAFGGGVVGIAVTLVGAAVFAAISFRAAQLGQLVVVRALFDLSNNAFAIAGGGFVTLLAAASCSGARSGALPPWAYWSGSVLAVANAVAFAALFASSGFFSAGGAYGFIVFAATVLWVVAVSLLMMARAGVPPRPLARP